MNIVLKPEGIAITTRAGILYITIYDVEKVVGFYRGFTRGCVELRRGLFFEFRGGEVDLYFSGVKVATGHTRNVMRSFESILEYARDFLGIADLHV